MEIVEGLTFDDVLLVPAESDVMPGEVSTLTEVVKGITLNTPIMSSAMDTGAVAIMSSLTFILIFSIQLIIFIFIQSFEISLERRNKND